MSLAADALQPAAVRALFTLGGRAITCNLADIITSAPGAGFDLDFDDAAAAIEIDFREPSYIGSKIGGDAYRFAMAAFMSANSIAETIEARESFAWSLIRLYYAAFYAGHGVLRLLGQSCSYLDRVHINRINELGAALGNGPSFPIQSGLYHCVMNTAQTGLTLSLAHTAPGGAHAIFWSLYDRFLASTMEDVLKGQLAPPDAQAVFLKLSDFRSTLAAGGSGSRWLSTVRNDIQYRHGLGVWEPPRYNRDGRARLARLAQQWTRDPMNVDVGIAQNASLDRYVAACAFSVSLCRALVSRISERSSIGAASFARHLLSLC